MLNGNSKRALRLHVASFPSDNPVRLFIPYSICVCQIVIRDMTTAVFQYGFYGDGFHIFYIIYLMMNQRSTCGLDARWSACRARAVDARAPFAFPSRVGRARDVYLGCLVCAVSNVAARMRALSVLTRWNVRVKAEARTCHVASRSQQ